MLSVKEVFGKCGYRLLTNKNHTENSRLFTNFNTTSHRKFYGGAENAGREIDGREIDGPMCRA